MCLTANKASWVQVGVAAPLSCYSRRWGHLRLHCFIVAFEYLVRILLHMDNLRKRQGNGRACASSL